MININDKSTDDTEVNDSKSHWPHMENVEFTRFYPYSPVPMFHFAAKDGSGLIVTTHGPERCLTDLEIDTIIYVLKRGKVSLIENGDAASQIDKDCLIEIAKREANPEILQVTENRRPNYVYLMVDDKNGCVKIGRSISPGKRERTLQSEKPSIRMIGNWQVPSKIEKKLHKKYQSQRVRGEWFRLTKHDISEISYYLKSIENE